MTRVKEITHKGKIIFSMDFSNVRDKDVINNIIRESVRYIRSKPENSVLTLTNIQDMHFSNEIREMFNGFMKGNKPYVKAGTVIGLNGLQQILYNSLLKVTGRDIRSFNNEIAAKEWLISR